MAKAPESESPPRAPRSTFIGRAGELHELRLALGGLARGAGSLLLLTGEPGIGKTRLAEELGALAADSGLRVLWGRCHEAEGRPPYWPWARIVQAYARVVDPAELAAELSPDALALAELIPELRPHLKSSEPEARAVDLDAARFRLFQTLSAVLLRLARRQPLLLVLDDLHWADVPSLRMLEFFSDELADAPIVVVGTFREVEVRSAPAVADILDRVSRRGRRLSLAGFTVDEVSSFVEAVAGQRVPQALAQRLRRETEGNPFFLDEIVRQFRGAGWWLSSSSGLPVSQGVRSAIRQRLTPLPDSTRALLAAAAVAGREFDLPLIEAALSMSRTALLEQLAPAVTVEILHPVAERAGCFRFSHALIRETIYEQLPQPERVDLHRRFGEILAERHHGAIDSYLPELAHHFFAAAAAGGEARALDYAERAGRHALRLFAYEEAADAFQRALHLIGIGATHEPERECELLLALAEAKNRAGQSEESSQACHRAATLARRIGSSALLACAAIGLCDVGVAWAEFGRSDDTLVHTLTEALDQLPAQETMLRARVMARLATELFWTRPLPQIDALSEQAVALARAAGDGPTLAYALMARIHCVSDPDSYARRRALIDEVIELSAGRGELAINAYLWRFGDELQFGDRSSAEASGEKLIRAVQDLRQPRDMWLIPAVRSRQAVLSGNFDEAERYAEQVVEYATGVSNAEQAYLALLFMIRREQGRHGEMLGGLAAIASQSVVPVWRASLALLYAENDEPEKALAEIDGLMRNGMAVIRRDLVWFFSVANLAVASTACGHREHAAALYEALVPYDGYTVAEGVFCYYGPVSFYLGILATTCERHDDARRHLDDALASARAFGARPFIARILLAQARALEVSGGEAARVASLRRQAGDMAESMAMAGVVAEARRTLADETAAPSAWQAALRCEGDHWLLSYKGRSSRLKSIKGFLYLARLLESPGQEFHVLDMAHGGGTREVAVAAGLGPILDVRAKAEIRDRLAELRAELAEAEDNHDGYRASKARAELATIGELVAGAVGLGGRNRTAGSDTERARAAVTKALRTAIERVEECDSALADILSRTIRTGVYCSYVPLSEIAISWNVRATPP